MSTSKLMTKASSLGRSVSFEKGAADLLFHLEHALLAAAGIDQDAERQRQIGFGFKVLDGLRLAVFENVEIILGQAGNQGAALILHVEEELHDLDVDLQGLGSLVLGLVLRLVLGGLGGRRRRVGALLSRQRNREQKDGEKGGNQARSAMYSWHGEFCPETLLVYPVGVRCTKEAGAGISIGRAGL